MFQGTTIALCLLLLIANSKPIYDYHNSYITQLTQINFKDQVTKIRQNTNYVSVVHFYKYDDGASLGRLEEFMNWVNEYNGVFRIGGVDCDESPKICNDEGVTVYPSYKVYPPTPIPTTTLTVLIASYRTTTVFKNCKKLQQNTCTQMSYKLQMPT